MEKWDHVSSGEAKGSTNFIQTKVNLALKAGADYREIIQYVIRRIENFTVRVQLASNQYYNSCHSKWLKKFQILVEPLPEESRTDDNSSKQWAGIMVIGMLKGVSQLEKTSMVNKTFQTLDLIKCVTLHCLLYTVLLDTVCPLNLIESCVFFFKPNKKINFVIP